MHILIISKAIVVKEYENVEKRFVPNQFSIKRKNVINPLLLDMLIIKSPYSVRCIR